MKKKKKKKKKKTLGERRKIQQKSVYQYLSIFSARGIKVIAVENKHVDQSSILAQWTGGLEYTACFSAVG